MIGYNIYHDDSLHVFITDTVYECIIPSMPNTCHPNWYDKMHFWIKVKAVYNIDSALSVADDSSEMMGVMINVNEQNEVKHFTLYPNPVAEQATLQTDIYLYNTTVTIHNSLGQMVREIKNITGQTIVIARNELPDGLYFIRLTEEKKNFLPEKFIIKRDS